MTADSIGQIEDDLLRSVSTGPSDGSAPDPDPAQEVAIEQAPGIQLAHVKLNGPPEGWIPPDPKPIKPGDEVKAIAEARTMFPSEGEIKSEVDNGKLKITERSDEKKVYLELPLSQLGLSDRAKCKATVWVSGDGLSQTHVLILDFQGKHARLAWMAGPYTIKPKFSRNQEFPKGCPGWYFWGG